MKNNLKKLAVAVLAMAALSGCSSMQVSELARADATPAQSDESRVSRPLPGYNSVGGYRMRRFAAVSVSG